MALEIKVPTLGESVVEATVGKWLKKIGEQVAVGETVVDLETDKVNVEVAATAAGVLEQIVAAEGATVGVGATLALLGTANGAVPAPAAPEAASAAPAATPAARAAEPPPASTDSPPAPAASHVAASATPTARNVAAVTGLDVAAVPGSGPGGRVMKDDVVAASAPAAPASAPAPASVPATPAPPPAAAPAAPGSPASAPAADSRGEERVKMSRRRQTIATRLVEAQHTAAMLTTFNEIDMGAVMDLRKRRRDAFKERNGVGLGFMSFFTKAAVGALKAFPLVNAEIQGDEIVMKRYYDIGVAVSTDDGLVVPVLRDADRLTFAGVEKGIESLARRARDGKLTIGDLKGGTFTITNGGIFGSLMSTPIINAPQVGILGMHKIQERPMVVGGQIVARPMMYVALSYDHRLIDGKEAVSFLVRIKELVEDPESLLLEG